MKYVKNDVNLKIRVVVMIKKYKKNKVDKSKKLRSEVYSSKFNRLHIYIFLYYSISICKLYIYTYIYKIYFI